MSAADELFLFAPYLFDANDRGFADEARRARALTASVWARPPCVPPEDRDLAQAYYATFLLSAWKRAELTARAGGSADPGVPAGPVIERKEGDVAVRYSDTAKTLGMSNTDRGPGTPYALWEMMWLRCGPLPSGKPRGAIVTRFGQG